MERELADLIVSQPESGGAYSGRLVAGFGFVEDTVVFSVVDRRAPGLGLTEIVSVDMANLSAVSSISVAGDHSLSLSCREDFPCIFVDRYDFSAENERGVERISCKKYDLPLPHKDRAERIVDMMNVIIGGVGNITSISH